MLCCQLNNLILFLQLLIQLLLLLLFFFFLSPLAHILIVAKVGKRHDRYRRLVHLA